MKNTINALAVIIYLVGCGGAELSNEDLDVDHLNDICEIQDSITWANDTTYSPGVIDIGYRVKNSLVMPDRIRRALDRSEFAVLNRGEMVVIEGDDFTFLDVVHVDIAGITVARGRDLNHRYFPLETRPVDLSDISGDLGVYLQGRDPTTFTEGKLLLEFNLFGDCS